MHTRTKMMTEGAMMVAITGVMLFLNRQAAGAIEYTMYWILSFPILIYAAKYGVQNACIPSICILIIAIFLALPSTMFYMFSCIMTGLVYGGGIRKQWKNGWLLLVTGLFTLISYIITAGIFATMFGYGIEEDIKLYTYLLSLFHIEKVNDIEQMWLLMTALFILLMSVLQTMCIHMVSNILLTRMKIKVHAMKPLLELRIKKSNGLLIIIIWVMFWLKNVLELNQELSFILFLTYVISKVIVVGYGVICLLCLLNRKYRYLIVVIMIGACLPYTQGIIAWIGLLDILFNIRKKKK